MAGLRRGGGGEALRGGDGSKSYGRTVKYVVFRHTVVRLTPPFVSNYKLAIVLYWIPSRRHRRHLRSSSDVYSSFLRCDVGRDRVWKMIARAAARMMLSGRNEVFGWGSCPPFCLVTT